MMDETKSLLLRAASEIRSLRQQNKLMNARLEMFDSVMILLHSSPAQKSQGMSEDIAWQIDNHINSQKKEPYAKD